MYTVMIIDDNETELQIEKKALERRPDCCLSGVTFIHFRCAVSTDDSKTSERRISSGFDYELS